MEGSARSGGSLTLPAGREGVGFTQPCRISSSRLIQSARTCTSRACVRLGADVGALGSRSRGRGRSLGGTFPGHARRVARPVRCAPRAAGGTPRPEAPPAGRQPRIAWHEYRRKGRRVSPCGASLCAFQVRRRLGLSPKAHRSYNRRPRRSYFLAKRYSPEGSRWIIAVTLPSLTSNSTTMSENSLIRNWRGFQA